MIYKYKDAFILTDEFGTCPNIEIDITDKTLFFIRPYHVKEDKKIFDKEMKRLLIMLFRYIERRLLGILKSSNVD